MSGEQLELLEELAGTAPQTYLQKQPSGQSTLRELYALAAQANLVPPSAQDDIARLHSLWDVALDHGLGGLVRDYVSEVRRRHQTPPPIDHHPPCIASTRCCAACR